MFLTISDDSPLQVTCQSGQKMIGDPAHLLPDHLCEDPIPQSESLLAHQHHIIAQHMLKDELDFRLLLLSNGCSEFL